MNKAQLTNDLILDEGIKTELYKDTFGKMTIGIGRNLTDRGINKAEAMFLLQNDIDMVLAELDVRVPWWRMLPEDAQRALANMCFNMGWPRLSGFKKMLAALEDGDFLMAAMEALDSQWAAQVHDRAIRIAELIRSA